MAEQTSVIHFANVTKRFGDFEAIHDVSFSVKPGEVIGFVGPNGAGKTTTISMMLGFLHPSSGTIKLHGNAFVTPSNAHKTHGNIGFAASDMAMFDNLTGKQYLDFMGGRLGCKPDIRKRLEQRLDPDLDKRLRQLSRGNKQKIALIAALQHDPELIILDEPTSGLDPLMQQTFLDIIKQEAERGATVFMSSHILSEVAHACSRVLFMKKGRIVTDESISDIEDRAGKVITVKGDADQLKIITHILPPKTVLISENGSSVVLRHDGDIHEILRWLSIKKFKDVTIEDRQLDDIFHDLYRDEEESA